jgi:glyoxylase-like metal-dependent hydrolase (beta-lactamase superfamily II)
MIKIGKFQIDAVDTGSLALDGGAMFGVVPKALWQRAYTEADELNRIPMASRPLLVRWDDKVMLIDSGSGNKLGEKLEKIYDIDSKLTPITVGLSKYGLTPEDITDFVYTHLHFDHSGGSTIMENGEPIPVFTKAKHYVQKEQYKWAMNPTMKDRASFMPVNWEPVNANGMLEFLEGEGEIYPGISVIPVDGHTKAMQMVKISDGGETLLFGADLTPTTAHISYPFIMGYDNFPLTTLAEKKKHFPVAYEDKWIIVFEHDHEVQAGRLGSNEKGLYVEEKIQISEL